MAIQYRKLDDPSKELRLMELFPAKEESMPLTCRLFHSRMAPNTYNALSYVWGDQVADRGTLIVDYPPNNENHTKVPPPDSNGSSKFSFTISIGKSLTSALKHIRLAEESVIIFVDAVCINQRDDIEKSVQVQAMFSIYQNATCVLAWLGPAQEHTDSAMDFLSLVDLILDLVVVNATGKNPRHLKIFAEDKLSIADQDLILDKNEGRMNVLHKLLSFISQIVRHEVEFGDLESITPIMRPLVGTFLDVFLQHEKVSEQLKGLLVLWEHEYWQRCWIVQEYLAATKLRILCGRKSTRPLAIEEMRSFFRKVWYLVTTAANRAERGSKEYFLAEVLPGPSTRSSIWESRYRRTDLSTYLMQMYRWAPKETKFKTTDTRDYINALLSISTDTYGLVPNYQKSARTFFIDVTIALLTAGHATFLHFNDSGRDASTLDLPSWAIDWSSTMGSPVPLMHFNASASRLAELSFEVVESMNVLNIAGSLLGTVNHAVRPSGLGYHCAAMVDANIKELGLVALKYLICAHMNEAGFKISSLGGFHYLLIVSVEDWVVKMLDWKISDAHIVHVAKLLVEIFYDKPKPAGCQSRSMGEITEAYKKLCSDSSAAGLGTPTHKEFSIISNFGSSLCQVLAVKEWATEMRHWIGQVKPNNSVEELRCELYELFSDPFGLGPDDEDGDQSDKGDMGMLFLKDAVQSLVDISEVTELGALHEAYDMHFRNLFSIFQVLMSCEKEHFFQLTGGYIGFSREDIEVGDVVAILYGTLAPLVLRPAGGAYKILRSVRVSRVMNGEFMRTNSPREIFRIV